MEKFRELPLSKTKFERKNDLICKFSCLIQSMCLYKYMNPSEQLSLYSFCLENCRESDSIEWKIYLSSDWIEWNEYLPSNEDEFYGKSIGISMRI